MILSEPVTWVPYIPWVFGIYIIWDAWIYQPNEDNFLTFSPPITVYILYILATKWASTTSRVVPEPYLDEIFHIPQAQNYCTGDFHIWDPKVTTPPGLYAFATWFGNLAGIRNCDVATLRYFNSLVLVIAMVYAMSCYTKISKQVGSGFRSASVLHNAFNIALFPPLFFFSGLFYTDVLSTCMVLKMYRDFLNGRSGVWLYLTGILALTMRQTNIFWVAIFLGGLEAVRTLKTIHVVPQEREPQCWQGIARAAFHRYERGEIHDPSLTDANLYDFALCGLSVGIAIIFHPILILKNLWPYISILISFAYFVYWNGGVVLGDKSNHIATIHLPQLLYLWPFITFFSFPLLLPSLFRLLTPRPLPHPSKILSTVATLLVALTITLAIIHYNTIIHPFTLADNRHYMFYIFRYSILLHPSIRYLLAPIYILCFYLCYSTLSPPPPPIPSSSSTSQTDPAQLNEAQLSIARTPAARRTLAQIQRRRNPAPSPNTNSNLTPNTSPNPNKITTDKNKHALKHSEAPRTSWFLIYILATTLSLVTAPLVEPRYFILPWLIFRLHVPSLTLPTSTSTSTSTSSTTSTSTTSSKLPPRKQTSRNPLTGFKLPRTRKEWRQIAKSWAYENHDPRLWVETAWFVGVNGVTMYVFLERGFEWVQEPGRVQRFMW